MQELHEIAIISIVGGTNVPLAEQAYKRRSEIQAANKQELADEVLRALDIDKRDIGSAAKQRPLHVVGHDKPWSIDICTTRTAEPLHRNFAHDLTQTLVLDLVVDAQVL